MRVKSFKFVLGLAGCLACGCAHQARTGFYHAVKVPGPDTVSLPVAGWTERAIVRKTPIVSVDDFESVSACGNIENPCFALQLTPEGTEKFRLATAASIGEYMAFVFEGRLITAPAVVKSEISGGPMVGACSGMTADEVSAMVQKLQTLISKKAARR